jgi:hypothetical protein
VEIEHSVDKNIIADPEEKSNFPNFKNPLEFVRDDLKALGVAHSVQKDVSIHGPRKKLLAAQRAMIKRADEVLSNPLRFKEAMTLKEYEVRRRKEKGEKAPEAESKIHTIETPTSPSKSVGSSISASRPSGPPELEQSPESTVEKESAVRPTSDAESLELQTETGSPKHEQDPPHRPMIIPRMKSRTKRLPAKNHPNPKPIPNWISKTS